MTYNAETQTVAISIGAGLAIDDGALSASGAVFEDALIVSNLSVDPEAGYDFTLIWDNVETDAYSSYDSSNGEWIIPTNKAGIYLLQWNVALAAESGGYVGNFQAWINGSQTILIGGTNVAQEAGWFNDTRMCYLALSGGDVVQFKIYLNGPNTYANNYNGGANKLIIYRIK